MKRPKMDVFVLRGIFGYLGARVTAEAQQARHFVQTSSVVSRMEMRAIIFIGCLVSFRLYTLFGLHILHEHAPYAAYSDGDVC